MNDGGAWNELHMEIDKNFAKKIIQTTIHLLKDVDIYSMNPNKDETNNNNNNMINYPEKGDCDLCLYQNIDFYTIRFSNIARSAFTHKILSKIVALDPRLIRDIQIIIQNHISLSQPNVNDNIYPFVIDITVFYFSVDTLFIIIHMPQFVFTHFRDSIAREALLELSEKYRTNEDNIQESIILPDNFEKDHIQLLSQILYRIINMDEKIPRLDFDLNYDDQNSKCYIILVKKLKQVNYSFLEYLFEQFETFITTIKFVKTFDCEGGALELMIQPDGKYVSTIAFIKRQYPSLPPKKRMFSFFSSSDDDDDNQSKRKKID